MDYSNQNGAVNNIPPQYKPLSPWAHVGYNLLFAIPVVGLIFLIIFAFNDENINRRNYARSFFCSFLVGIVIAFLIIIPLSAIIMNAGSSTISQANFALFVQEFGELSDNVKMEASTLRAEYAINGIIKTEAQLYYELANNKEASTSADVPNGENFYYDFIDFDEECYEVKDFTLIGEQYSDVNFYGSENDGEKVYITSKGNVFTLPGYKEEQEDGTLRYYVNARGDYYTE